MHFRAIRRLVLFAAAWLVATAGRAADDTATHRARAGDTVPRLSWLYRVRADAIRAANPQLHSDALTPGEVVVIPLASTIAAAEIPPPRRAEPLPSTPPRAIAVAVVSAPPSPTTVLPSRPPVEAIEPDPAPARDEHPRVDFLAAARRLANERIAYNGAWTPPGQRASWTMDCSNTARWLYQDAAGVELPRTASDQYESLRVAGRLWETPRDDASRPERLDRFLATRLQPGDLLFWENTYKPVRNPDITHVMIFLGRDAAGRLLMAGSQGARGVNIYPFDPHATKGGYSAWFGLVHRHGRFVAYGRPLATRGEN